MSTLTPSPAAPARPLDPPATASGGGADVVVPPAPRRDVALDLLRGLAMVVLVVNHMHLDSVLERVTEPFLSAAEALVSVSGVVTGMVFGRRWLALGARATTRALLLRSRQLYVASVVVVALSGLLTLVPGLATEALTIAPRTTGPDLYAFDGPLRTLLAVVTLEAGPWQFNILGFFIASLAAAPAVLHALSRGWWRQVLAASGALYLLGRGWTADVLPAQSERPFPLLVWQLLFVCGMVLGWHRERLTRLTRRAPRAIAGAVLAVALVAGWLRLHALGVDPLGLDARLGLSPADWAAFTAEHYRKTSLDPLRVVTIASLTGALYLGLRRFEPLARRTAGRLLLPLGRNSFYVFIMHVFVCLAVASVPPLAGDGPGPLAAAGVQVGCVGLLWLMVRHRFLFRWVPR